MSNTSAIRLDKTRDYGEIHPPHHGASYHQGLFYFDAHGVLVEKLLDAEATKALKNASARAAADEAAQEARRKVLEAAGIKSDDGGSEPAAKPEKARGKPGPKPKSSAAPAAKPEEGGVDLVAWANGSEQYLFDEVRKAIQEKYGRTVANKAQAIEFLQEENVVPGAA